MPLVPSHRYLSLAAGMGIVAAAAVLSPTDAARSGAVASAQGTPPAGSPSRVGTESDDLEILIIQALDQVTNLDVQDKPILEAISQLTEGTGIPVEVEQGVLGLLPYGSKTMVSAKIEGRPLKEALAALLRPIGLEQLPEPRRLLIRPTPALRRVVRRATWEELETLDKLRAKPWTDELFASLTFQFQDAPAADAPANRATLKELADSVGAGSAAEVLELACDKYGWSWYPEGSRIAILTKSRQVERHLETRISVQYVQVELREALLDLAGRAGVLLRMDPGVLASLPSEVGERFSLTIKHATVRQALEVVAGQTGLGYFIEPGGLRLTTSTLAPVSGGDSSGSMQAAAQAVQALRADPIVGQITFPRADGSSYSLFVRESDLPPEVNGLRKARIKDAIADLGRALATQPARD